jgi:hypothetical protein
MAETERNWPRSSEELACKRPVHSLAHELTMVCSSFLRIFSAVNDPNFDCSSGEPDGRFETVYRVLRFEHNLVKICLVNALKIESAVLVSTRRDGENIMKPNPPRNVSRCYAVQDNQEISISRSGGFSVSRVGQWRYQPRLSEDLAEYRM